jgi:hypothetical protein
LKPCVNAAKTNIERLKKGENFGKLSPGYIWSAHWKEKQDGGRGRGKKMRERNRLRILIEEWYLLVTNGTIP